MDEQTTIATLCTVVPLAVFLSGLLIGRYWTRKDQRAPLEVRAMLAFGDGPVAVWTLATTHGASDVYQAASSGPITGARAWVMDNGSRDLALLTTLDRVSAGDWIQAIYLDEPSGPAKSTLPGHVLGPRVEIVKLARELNVRELWRLHHPDGPGCLE